MLLGWLIRIVLVLLVLRVLWGLVSRLWEGASKPARSRPQKQVALVRDPVCGTYLQASRALSSRAGTKVHYFCSEECRQAFDRGVRHTPHEVSS